MPMFRKNEDIVRVIKGVRDAERMMSDELPLTTNGGTPSPTMVVVQVTGAKIEVNSPPYASPDGAVTEKGYYPGKCLYYNVDKTDEVLEFFSLDEPENFCLVRDISDVDLVNGGKYHGVVQGLRNFKPVVLVDLKSGTPGVSPPGSPSGSFPSGGSPAAPLPCSPGEDGYRSSCVPEGQDGDDPVGVRETICIDGKLYVTRGRKQIVSANNRFREDWYELVTSQEGCCDCNPPSAASGSGPLISKCCSNGLNSQILAVVSLTAAVGVEVEFVFTLVLGTDGVYTGSDESGVYELIARVRCTSNNWRFEGVVLDGPSPDDVVVSLSGVLTETEFGVTLEGIIDISDRMGFDAEAVISADHPCPWSQEEECVVDPDRTGCANISSRYKVFDEDATELATLAMIRGITPAQYRSQDGQWYLVRNMDAAPPVWSLINLDGREWEILESSWDCCAVVLMTSTDPEGPTYEVLPTYECCPAPVPGPDVNCSGIETTAPSTLTLTFSNGTGIYAHLNGTSYTMVYNGTQWEVASPGPEFTSITMVLSAPGGPGEMPGFNVVFAGCFDLSNGHSPTTCDPFTIFNAGASGTGTCGDPFAPPSSVDYTISG